MRPSSPIALVTGANRGMLLRDAIRRNSRSQPSPASASVRFLQVPRPIPRQGRLPASTPLWSEQWRAIGLQEPIEAQAEAS